VGTPGGPVADFAGVTLCLTDVSVATPDGVRHAPASISICALPGELTVLRGPNGEGKSTALLALAGLLAPDHGAVTATVAGQQIDLSDADAEAWTRQCAWVPQRPELGPEGRELSLGQRQLKAYERALASGRPVLLLDEPTAHLDGEARSQLVQRIVGLARAGATVVAATHDPLLIDAADAVVEVRAAAVGSAA